MAYKLVSLKIRAGLYRNGSRYQSKGRWTDGHLVRWLPDGSEYPPLLPVGGWTPILDTAESQIDAVGFPRHTHSWRGNDGSAWLAVGTTGPDSRAYAYSVNVLTDITPAGLVDGAADGFLLTGGLGWGEGGWGDGPWGGSAPAGTFIDAETWSLDNFGEFLLGVLTGDGKVYSWDRNIANDFVQVTNSPTGVRAVVVTPERFVMALGTGSDARLVSWASRETLTTWAPAVGNTAGSQTLATVGRLIAGRRTARETLLWTDADLWAAVFIGAPFVYSFQQRGDNCGLIGPNAVTIAEGAAYWMSNGQFFVYDGAVRPVPCDVADYVFGDLNRTQKAKIVAVPVSQFGEVWWFYPSASGTSLENDRYVAVNYRMGFWMTGGLGRAAGAGAGVFAQPMMWDLNGKLYGHEVGQARDGVPAFVESGPLEMGDGDRTVDVLKLIPDERALGQVEATFFASFQPMAAEQTFGPYTLASETDVRFSGRQFRLRLQEPDLFLGGLFADGSGFADGSLFADGGAAGEDFRIGTFRVGLAKGSPR